MTQDRPLAASAGATDESAPLVSVLVASFNHARYLEDCLDSLLHDGYPNLELVLIDDGSSDGCFEIATRWVQAQRQRLRGGARLAQQANRGVVPTLNTLIAQARGEYFALLASDDQLLAGGIRARVRHLQTHPAQLAVFGDAQLIDLEGGHAADSAFDAGGSCRAALRHDRTRGIELICHWIMPGPVFLARRDVTARIGPYDERYTYEDRDYYLRLLAAGALGFVDLAVARYRVPPVKKKDRYDALAQDRERIERAQLPHFHGLERIALLGMVQRHRRPRPRWFRLVRRGIALLRRFNCWRAARLLRSGGA